MVIIMTKLWQLYEGQTQLSRSLPGFYLGLIVLGENTNWLRVVLAGIFPHGRPLAELEGKLPPAPLDRTWPAFPTYSHACPYMYIFPFTPHPLCSWRSTSIHKCKSCASKPWTGTGHNRSIFLNEIIGNQNIFCIIIRCTKYKMNDFMARQFSIF